MKSYPNHVVNKTYRFAWEMFCCVWYLHIVSGKSRLLSMLVKCISRNIFILQYIVGAAGFQIKVSHERFFLSSTEQLILQGSIQQMV